MNWKTLLFGKGSKWRPLQSLLAIYLLPALFAMFFVDRIIFFPPPPSYTETTLDLVTFSTSSDETIAAFHTPASPGRPTLLYAHGNAEDAGHNLGLAGSFAAIGWGSLIYDYPGYGLSTGRPTEKSASRAADAAWDFLTRDQKLAPGSIVLVGRSVGSGLAVYLAEKHDAAALVLISPLTSAFAVRPPAQYLLPGDRFPNLKRIRHIDTPLLVIHGETDDIIPISHGRKLLDASPAETKSLLPIPSAGHNDLFPIAFPRIFDEIVQFVPQ